MCFKRRKKEEKPVVKEEKKTEPAVKEEKKAEPVVEEKKAPAAPAKGQEELKKEVKDIYHISQNKDEKSPNFKKWRVRKANSTKTIQYFDTQVEAIKFAEDLAEKAEGHIVIHKRDGSIRKQDYSK